ncbi:hypothetical protein [Chelatococcus sp. HY11]|uniref:hypothetical protein n=1 Tax=Chelatococcus sp. HY11 TaxID=2835634 RepID=UPI001BCACF1A|nr:hypothetical protein [Chelatococcus sp. HY11]MBS7743553.1 hypothetical protein [Chelatococcus sp. HY11]CAH1664063.1 conserved hypothetical protein [Hyphomicrobiales bacterium]CAH1688064.1 conserved hypothetical protein [Hyphomicrobiales bacterium]
MNDDVTDPRYETLLSQISLAQMLFGDLLRSYLVNHHTTEEQYVRYLSFQFHLTKDVQRYFLSIAGHPDLARRRKLRAFLVNFANEEELHYLVAANDLHKIGRVPLAMPFDVELWHSYFKSLVADRPFMRMGAATILENISDGPARPWVKKALTGEFLTKENTKFLVLHQHEALPHGVQIMDAIATAGLSDHHYDDLIRGAKRGTVLYLRMAEWALKPDSLASIVDSGAAVVGAEEMRRIVAFEMAELDDDASHNKDTVG